MGPEERILKALEDVQDCASFVVAASEGKDLVYYRRDRLFRQALERNLEIIGEEIGRISRHDVETASRISEYRRIVAFRNRLTHGDECAMNLRRARLYSPKYLEVEFSEVRSRFR